MFPILALWNLDLDATPLAELLPNPILPSVELLAYCRWPNSSRLSATHSTGHSIFQLDCTLRHTLSEFIRISNTGKILLSGKRLDD